MDPLALIEDYLSDQENGMKNLITKFLNQAMLQEALRRSEPVHTKRTDAPSAHRNGHMTDPQDPVWRDDPPETPVPEPVRDGGLGGMSDREGSGFNRRILPHGDSKRRFRVLKDPAPGGGDLT